MSKFTEKQLISHLRQLKEIKPRQEWASLLKSQILEEKTEIQKNSATFAGFNSFFFQKKFAYAFAAFLFLAIGVLGFFQYTMPGNSTPTNLAKQSQANLTAPAGVSQSIAKLNTKINNFAKVAKTGQNVNSAINDISSNASDLAQNIKDNQVSDPATIKAIANSLKTLSSVSGGTDLTSNPGVEDLYQTVVERQITDLQKETLTDDQKTTLSKAEDLYSQGNYSDALEQLLLIGQ